MSVNMVKRRFPQLLTALDRAPMAGLLCAAALLLGVTLAWTRSAAWPGKGAAFETGAVSQASSGEKGPLGNGLKGRLHEGGEITNQAGYFESDGRRLAFVSADNEHRFTMLENGALEEVAATVAGGGKQGEWIVSGQVFEYQGVNFLLINRVELKGSSSASGPVH
jgi:hypothetical protein